MAERGAHLTQTALQRPTIFEVVAQHTLGSTIQPALKRVVEFLVSSNPERYGWLEGRFDEIYVILNLLLQNYYLTHHGGSFSEIFYGLCRFTVRADGEDGLDKKGRLLSLLQIVLLPYIWHKIEYALQTLEQNYAYGTYNAKKKLLLNLLLKTYKLGRISWETAILGYYLTYLGGRSKSHSPLFHLFGLALRYSEEENELMTIWENVLKPKRWFSPKNLGYGFLRVLEVGAFVLQFVNWWQAEKLTTNVTSLPVPSPPSQTLEDPDLRKKCPLCRKFWRIETLLPVSGYVFCFRCIMQYVQENRCCPVTGYPASAQDLIRLYK